jgi:hypothetical protein
MEIISKDSYHSDREPNSEPLEYKTSTDYTTSVERETIRNSGKDEHVRKKEFYVEFEVFTAVKMKMAVFWAVAHSTRLHGATTQKTAIFKEFYLCDL